jgi:hypothetical protein
MLPTEELARSGVEKLLRALVEGPRRQLTGTAVAVIRVVVLV